MTLGWQAWLVGEIIMVIGIVTGLFGLYAIGLPLICFGLWYNYGRD